MKAEFNNPKIAHQTKIKFCRKCGKRRRENQPNTRTVRKTDGTVLYRKCIDCTQSD